MKNERGIKMKRVLCLLLVLCFIPALCNAATSYDFDTFCGYAYVIGNIEFDESNKTVMDGRDIYTTKTGFVGFQYDSNKAKSISVYGNGDEFLVYVFSAICTLEESATNILDNYSTFMWKYFDAHTKGEQYGTTKGGIVFLVKPYEDGYLFISDR